MPNMKIRRTTMGTFEVKKSGDGLMFNLKAGNGEVIGSSEVYNRRDSLDNGIESVKKNAPDAPVEDQTAEGFEKKACPKFEVFADKAGKTRFRLKARNGEIIATGESYKAKASCLNGIDSIKRNADSEVVKEY